MVEGLHGGREEAAVAPTAKKTDKNEIDSISANIVLNECARSSWRMKVSASAKIISPIRTASTVCHLNRPRFAKRPGVYNLKPPSISLLSVIPTSLE